MPVKLIQNLRLLNPSLPITRFSLMKSLKSTRVGPIFSRVFHHDLKFQSLSKNNLGFPNVTIKMEPLLGTARSYSTRRLGSDVKASKSLIEDEAELSDWVSELRSDSFKSSKLYSDSDDNGDVGRGSRNRENLGKGRRDSDFDNYGGDSGRGRGGYSSRGRGNSFSRDSSRGNGRFGGEFEGRRMNGSRGGGRESYSSDYGMSTRGRGGLSSRGRGGLRNGGRRSRDSDSDDYGRENYSSDYGMSSRGRGGLRNGGRGSRDSDDYGREGLSNRGRGGRNSFESRDSRGKGRFVGEGRNEGFMSRRNENASRGGRNSIRGSRGGRGSEFGAGRDRSGGRDGRLVTSGNGLKRGGLMMSDTDDIDDDDEDEEDEDVGVGKIRDSFRELISEGDSEEESEAVDDDEEEEEAEDDDGHEVFKSACSFSKSETRDGPVVSPTSSLGGSDSYLSGTR